MEYTTDLGECQTLWAVVGVLKFEVVGNQKVAQDMIVAIRWIWGAMVYKCICHMFIYIYRYPR